MKRWLRQVRDDALRDLELTGVYLTADQAQQIAQLLHHCHPPAGLTDEQVTLIARFTNRASVASTRKAS